MASSAPIPVDEQGRVEVDLPCLECGYNLRTLSLEEGRCPECELPVGRSAVGNRLRYCDPRWLTQIGWGLNLFAVSLLLVGGGIGSFAVMGSGAEWDVFLIVPAALIACLVVCACYAVWKSTKPDPLTRKDEWAINPRKLARLALIATCVTPVLLAASTLALGDGRWQGFVALGWGLAACGGVLCLFVYASQLARRAGASALMWFARVSVVAPCIATAFQLAVSNDVLGWRAWVERVLTPWLATSPQPQQSYTYQGQTYFYTPPSPLYVGPFRFDDWWDLWRTVEMGSAMVTGVTVLLGLIALLWLWPVIWRQAKLARESWAGE
ncbi:MAG: hypothetical protein AAGB29_07275 [Planctomycetota bacterium]